MNKKKLRNFMFLIFLGLFVFTHKPFFVWMFIAVVILFHEDNKSSSSSFKQSNSNKINEDARLRGLSIPKSRKVRDTLSQIYKNLMRSKKLYPHLEEEYEKIVDEMWEALVGACDHKDWLDITMSVLTNWPDQKSSGLLAIKNQVAKVKELTQQWDEAQSEVENGAHV